MGYLRDRVPLQKYLDKSFKDVINLWHERTAEGDVEAVLALMADDTTFFIAGRPPMKGKSSFEKGLRGLLAHSEIKSKAHVEEVQVSGDFAYAISEPSVEILAKSGGDS
jgi:uncharacterized protein (TIGR02246 family)